MKNLQTFINERLIGGPSEGGISDIVKELPNYNLYDLNELRHEINNSTKHSIRFYLNNDEKQFYVSHITNDGEYITLHLTDNENEEMSELSSKLKGYSEEFFAISANGYEDKKLRIYSVRFNAPENRGYAYITITYI